jgi:hypothetical protein
MTPNNGGDRLNHIQAMLDEAAKMILKHPEMLAEHDRRMTEIDERLDRVGRHLEVLSDICDGLIRNKQDKKKRS